jgi:hypothetical protein
MPKGVEHVSSLITSAAWTAVPTSVMPKGGIRPAKHVLEPRAA